MANYLGMKISSDLNPFSGDEILTLKNKDKVIQIEPSYITTDGIVFGNLDNNTIIKITENEKNYIDVKYLANVIHKNLSSVSSDSVEFSEQNNTEYPIYFSKYTSTEITNTQIDNLSVGYKDSHYRIKSNRYKSIPFLDFIMYVNSDEYINSFVDKKMTIEEFQNSPESLYSNTHFVMNDNMTEIHGSIGD